MVICFCTKYYHNKFAERYESCIIFNIFHSLYIPVPTLCKRKIYPPFFYRKSVPNKTHSVYHLNDQKVKSIYRVNSNFETFKLHILNLKQTMSLFKDLRIICIINCILQKISPLVLIDAYPPVYLENLRAPL